MSLLCTSSRTCMGSPGWAWPLVISAFAVLGLAEYCPGSDVRYEP